MKHFNRLPLALAAVLGVSAHLGAQPITDPAKHLASSLDGWIQQIRALKAQARNRALTPDEEASAPIGLQRYMDRIYLSFIPGVSLKAIQKLAERGADKQ